jgi:hypothetical protein
MALVFFAVPRAVGDEVAMQNGDRYVGKVLSLSSNTLVMQNEVLGTVRLPREKVAAITLGSAPPASAAPLPSPAPSMPVAPVASRPAAAPNASPPLGQLSEHTNLIRQVQKQFLSGAGPEANQKFDELLSGLMSGKLNVDDLRGQAQAAADQLRALKRDSGEDPGFAADTYLTILDHFLKETAPAASTTNAVAPSTARKPSQADPEP